MAEFAWKARERGEPEGFGNPAGESPEEDSRSFVLRWVKRPDGRHEQVELPLTPERFLNPRATDKIVQSIFHDECVHAIHELLHRYFLEKDGVMVLHDVKLVLGRGLPGPAPDVSVALGLQDFDPTRRSYRVERSYRVAKYGVPPGLVIEVLSPDEARIRRVDEEDKVEVYARAGIREYLLVDPPRRANRHRCRLRLYRLGPDGRYGEVEPGEQRRFRSEATGLSFAVSPEGDRIDVFDPQGNRLLTSKELEKAHQAAERKVEATERKARAAERKASAAEQKARAAERKVEAAEQKAAQEAEARKAEREAAEAELARLRAELERLNPTGG